jgi:hypothetical protein
MRREGDDEIIDDTCTFRTVKPGEIYLIWGEHMHDLLLRQGRRTHTQALDQGSVTHGGSRRPVATTGWSTT